MKLINRNFAIVIVLLSIVNSYGQEPDPGDPGIDPGTPLPISDYSPHLLIVAIVLGFYILKKSFTNALNCIRIKKKP